MKCFSGPPARAEQLKEFTEIWKYSLSVAESLGLGLKWLICTVGKQSYYTKDKNICNINGPPAPLPVPPPFIAKSNFIPKHGAAQAFGVYINILEIITRTNMVVLRVVFLKIR
jgi:hypothetical protein